MFVDIHRLTKSPDINTCLLSKDVFQALDLSENKKYVIHLGQLNIKAKIKYIENEENTMYFGKDIFKKLLLLSKLSLNIWKKDNDIYLGPVVGVFVNTRYLSSIKEGDIPISCEKNIQANEVGRCFLYFFSIEKINWIENKIKGYIFSPKWNQMKYYWLPMPNVIYDRGVKFDKKEKLLVRHIRKQFVYHPSIHFINSRDYLSKWHLYKRLKKYDEIKELLPETICYESFTDVKNMLNKYDLIFLKSYYGSRGREVISIAKKDGVYRMFFYDKCMNEKEVSSLEQLKEQINSFIGNKKFIVQQGIKLLKFDGRCIDLRVLLEKDKKGNWIAIYNQARIAKKNYTITNCSVGGDITNYSHIYNVLKSKSKHIHIPEDADIRKKAIEVATFIEKEYGKFGEIGMDMAVDDRGKIWFLEGNTKPDKDPEPFLEDTEGISPQFLSILEYSQFLTRKGGSI